LISEAPLWRGFFISLVNGQKKQQLRAEDIIALFANE
jgi:hypothetical protein